MPCCSTACLYQAVADRGVAVLLLLLLAMSAVCTAALGGAAVAACCLSDGPDWGWYTGVGLEAAALADAASSAAIGKDRRLLGAALLAVGALEGCCGCCELDAGRCWGCCCCCGCEVDAGGCGRGAVAEAAAAAGALAACCLAAAAVALAWAARASCATVRAT